jgi:putative ABC transport system permease protein
LADDRELRSASFDDSTATCYVPEQNLRELLKDLVFAWRRVRSAPVFVLFATASVGGGIGATVAVYSVIDTIFLRPPSISEPDRVANLYRRDPRDGASVPLVAFSGPDFLLYKASQTTFASMAAWTRFRLPLVANGVTEFITGERVTGDYFTVVGFRAALGRTLQPADDQPGASRVIVLSDTLWRLRFSADPGVVGRAVNLGGREFEIVGVMPATFRGVDMPNLVPTGAWIPLLSTDANQMTDRKRSWLLVKGRLKSDRTMAQALAELRTIGRRLDLERSKDSNQASGSAPEWFLMPSADVRMHESLDRLVGPLAGSIMIAVVLALLVACTNLANMRLGHDASRRHERAVRLALGASRWRIAREELMDAGLLTLSGGLLALIVAHLTMSYLVTTTFELFPGYAVQLAPEFRTSTAAIFFGSTLLALFAYGVVPALHSSRSDLNEALAIASSGAHIPRWRGRRILIAGQVAISSGFVAVALLCAQQVWARPEHDSGLDLDRLAVVDLDFRLSNKAESYASQVVERALYLARLQPGVDSAAASSGLPIDPGVPRATIAVREQREAGLLVGTQAALLSGTPDVFRVLGVDVVSGRAFDARDTIDSQPVALVSRALSTELFSDLDAVGKRVLVQQRLQGKDSPAVRAVTIVGVTEDTDVGAPGRRDRGIIYIPFSQHYEPTVTIVARSDVANDGLPEALRRTIRRVDAEIPILRASLARELNASRSLVMEVGAVSSGLLGALTMVLAMTGLLGLVMESVVRRTREIGIRMALGAHPADVIRMVLLDGVQPVLWGLAIGAFVGVVLRLAFRPMFIRLVPTFHWSVLVLIPVLFVAGALLASYFAARRASRVEPNVALRHL